jgi:biotin-dependent carboxylase-like uncharacterized protein
VTAPSLVAVDPGPLSTLQDLGRRGYQRFGVSTAGAMVPWLMQLANRLAGNPPSMAAVELTLSGGLWRVEGGPIRLAVGGAFPLAIDGHPVASWQAHVLEPGQRIEIGSGGALYGYLAATGGFAVEPTLGSASTHVRSRLGGIDGGAIRSGQALRLRTDEHPTGPNLSLDPSRVPQPPPVFRVVLGPQDDYFTRAGLDALLDGEYTVTPDVDRMGYRLVGPPIGHSRGHNIISDGIAPGSIQVPGSGQPIVLMADRQTTGGYPKIATVISVDLGFLAQRRPGDRVRFSAVDLSQAADARGEFRRALERLDVSLAPARSIADLSSSALLGVNLIDGVVDGRHTLVE